MTPSVDESPRIVPHSSLSTGSLVWHASDGRRARTLVAKATFELKPGTSPLAKVHDAVNATDVHWDGDPRSTLRAASDLVPYKPRVDVVVTGHAYAPSGHAVRSLFARLVVGPLSKTIAVFGDRAILPGGELGEPAELDGIPLCWERAAGGPGTGNPAGIAHDPFRGGGAPAAGGGPLHAPNFQPPGFFSSSILDPIPPAGFGPIAADWPERAAKLGPHASAFDAADWTSRPLPRGLDASYFNCAPADQQLDGFDPNARILLENLHPEHARLVTHLESIAVFGVLRREGHADHRFELCCDTVWIDTDRGVCCLTFRGTIADEATANAEIHFEVEPARDVRPSLPRQPEENEGTQAAVSAPLHESGPSQAIPSVDDTALAADWQAPALGAVSAADSVVWIDEAQLPDQLKQARDREPVNVPDPESTLTLSAVDPSTATLPFGRSPVASPPVQAHAPLPDPTGTIIASLTFETQPLPAAWQQPQPPPPPGAAVLPPPLAPPAPAAPPAPSPAIPPTPPLVAPGRPAFAPPLPVATPSAHDEDAGPASDSDARTERPPPPPLLAAVLPATPREPLPSISDEPTTATFDPEAVPLDRWAEITAELDKALRPRAEVLRDCHLSEAGFSAADRHWKGELATEAATGRFAMRLASDAAYVGALERLRERPIVPIEYAQILSAAERLQVPAVLRDLQMPAAAHLPIVRLWTIKLARDAQLSREMIQAVAALRDGGPGQPATAH